jgi:hypothetical protein
MDIKTQEDEIKLKGLIEDLKSRGIEYVNKTSLFKESTEVTGVSTEMGIAQSFANYLKDQNISEELKETAAELMADMGML